MAAHFGRPVYRGARLLYAVGAMPTQPPFPLPDTGILTLSPVEMAAAAVSTVRKAFGVDLDYTPRALARLDALLAERTRAGQYTAERYPAMLALLVGAYTGEVLRQTVAGGAWGEPHDDIFATPLPFLLYTRGEYARQINVVEDVMAYVWTGNGPSPYGYFTAQLEALRKLGFTIAA
jgi:hypothetical protein